MTWIDLEWFSEIFNNTEHRAASLRQLNFLYRNVEMATKIVYYVEMAEDTTSCYGKKLVHRILPTQPHMGPADFPVTCSIEL